jgi:hypothetical protein
MVTRTVLLLIFLTGMLSSQDAMPEKQQMNLNDYLALAKEDLAVQSKKLMLVNMELTEAEGKMYWPIYDAYFAERSKIMDERIEMFKMIGEKYGTMTDEDAAKIADTFFSLENKLNQLEKETYNKIKDELSSLRGIQFLQIQRQIDTIVRLQISAQFPLLK